MATTYSTLVQDIQIAYESPPWPMTALILCGGKSTRMGRSKAFLPYRGTVMINHIIDVVQQLFTEVILVTNEPDLFDGLSIDIVKDILPYRGPLGGILSGLLIATNYHSFVFPCDMPFISREIIEAMVNQHDGNDLLVLSHDLKVEPLIGIYSKKCIKALEESLFVGEMNLHNFVSGLDAQTYCYERETNANTQNSLPPYFNIDTPQDYTKAITALD
jgi:molybdopterin-guanine dinucleotide biosynthesis protein A